MLCLGIDPSAESPGYAIWCTELQRHTYVSATPPVNPERYVHHMAVEGCWSHGPMGKAAHWGLGFDAAWRLSELRRLAMHGIYIIAPKHWRNAIPDRPGHHTIKDGLPKPVIVARLRKRYGCDSTEPDDCVEARGIAEAVANILQRPLKKDRKGLREVKR